MVREQIIFQVNQSVSISVNVAFSLMDQKSLHIYSKDRLALSIFFAIMEQFILRGDSQIKISPVSLVVAVEWSEKSSLCRTALFLE